MLKLIAILVSASLTLAACGPSPEARAQAEQRRKEECFNKICPGDVQPQYDFKMEILFKRNGRWFIGPKAYNGSEGRFAFYWPSKTPMTGRPDRGNYPERGQAFYKVAIEFFVESGSNVGETYGFIEQAIARESIVRREQLYDRLELIQTKESSAVEPIATYYLATQLKTPSGLPAVAYCRTAHPDNMCTSGFVWKPGIRVYVRFNQSYRGDWPEIYSEIVKVLSYIKER